MKKGGYAMNVEEEKDFYINDSYSPYTTVKKTEEHTTYIIDVPSKYNIELEHHPILPGMSIIISHANLMQKYSSEDVLLYYPKPEDMLIVSYLIEGEGQIAVDKDKFIPLKDGDIHIHLNPYNNNYYSYFGENEIAHILINRDKIRKYEKTYTDEYIKILKEIYKKSNIEQIIVIKSEYNLQKILDEMKSYQTEDLTLRRVYHQIKIIEIIIYLYKLKFISNQETYKTYTDAQIRVVRKIKNHLSRDIASYKSLESLALNYGINLTTLKNCFKDMYGKPLYTWYREYKFKRATDLIKNTDYPISKIANMIGYKSSSKFTKAFKKEMGVLPSSYRKKK